MVTAILQGVERIFDLPPLLGVLDDFLDIVRGDGLVGHPRIIVHLAVGLDGLIE